MLTTNFSTVTCEGSGGDYSCVSGYNMMGGLDADAPRYTHMVHTIWLWGLGR